ATMLGEKMEAHEVAVWLVNTGWVGGPHGVGQRMDLIYTRRLIAAALSGDLEAVAYREHPVFGIAMPMQCPGVPPVLLDPSAVWPNTEAYMHQTHQLAEAFIAHFQQFERYANAEIQAGGPRLV
ncbi:MAG: phosphoenolpyruvate carboxykinase (ATP), partial [Bacteroidota bacterium]